MHDIFSLTFYLAELAGEPLKEGLPHTPHCFSAILHLIKKKITFHTFL